MDLRKLRIFQSAIEGGSFARAAEALFLSQPSVSGHIKDLERQVGLPLFQRTPRGVRPTQAGDVLADYARRIFALEGDADAALAALRGAEAGRIAVIASSTPGTYLLPQVVARFGSEHPAVRIHLEISDTSDVERRIQDMEADIGLIGEPISPRELDVLPWVTDELVLIAPPAHPWARKGPGNQAALEAERLILREPGSSIRALTDAWLAERGIRVRTTLELGSPEAVNMAVASGLGVSITTRYSIDRELRLAELVVVDFPGLPIVRTLNVVTNTRRPLLPAPRALFDWILASPPAPWDASSPGKSARNAGISGSPRLPARE